jgi:hypothetical protein
MISGAGRTQADPSALRLQITRDVRQRWRNSNGMVVWPLLLTRVFTTEEK